jgi:hypothetical protein
MERETGIEPATNSLEGCDSTIELLPLILFFSNLHCVQIDQTCPSSQMDRISTKSGSNRSAISRKHQIGKGINAALALVLRSPLLSFSRSSTAVSGSATVGYVSGATSHLDVPF